MIQYCNSIEKFLLKYFCLFQVYSLSLQHVYYPSKKRKKPNLNVKTSQNNAIRKIQGSILIPETLKRPSHYPRMFQVKDWKKGDLLNHCFQICLILIAIDKSVCFPSLPMAQTQRLMQ